MHCLPLYGSDVESDLYQYIFLIVGAVGFVIIFALIFMWRNHWSAGARLQKRLLRPPQKTGTSGLKADHLVELTGRIRFSGDGLVSPLAGVTCVYYRSLVSVMVGEGQEQRWEPLAEKTKGRGFKLEDDEGAVVVKFANSELMLTEETATKKEVIDSVTEEQAELLARAMEIDSASLIGKSVALSEIVLGEGHRITVQSLCNRDPIKDRLFLGTSKHKTALIHNQEVEQ